MKTEEPKFDVDELVEQFPEIQPTESTFVEGHVTFHEGLRQLINQHSMENPSNTPDYILAKMLEEMLMAFANCVRARDEWYDGANKPGIVEPGPAS